MAEKTTPTVDKRNLKARGLTAAVCAAFFLSLLWFGGGETWGRWAYLALMALSILAGMRELALMANTRGFAPSVAAGTAVAWALLAHFHFAKAGQDPLPLWV